jgi:hypothetical protein
MEYDIPPKMASSVMIVRVEIRFPFDVDLLGLPPAAAADDDDTARDAVAVVVMVTFFVALYEGAAYRRP